MRVALLTTDNREHERTYEKASPRFGPAVESVLDGLSRRNDLEIHVIACTQRPMNAPGKLSENTWFHLLDVPKIGWLRTGYQGCVRAIRKRLQIIQPDLVHGQGTERECALSAALSGYPNVVTIHGNMGQVAKSVHARIGSYLWCAARLEAFALRRTGGVFCNSAYTERMVQHFNEQTWRVANALRRSFFDVPLPDRSSSKPIILTIGVVAPFKRQVELLAIADQLHQRGNHFEWQFVGAANERTPYARQFFTAMEKAEGSGYARHVPPMHSEDLIKLYDQADALVHAPSEEAFGLVVAEGLARNLKFFGLEIGGVPDIAAGVETAELFAPDQTDAMADAIERWLGGGFPRPKNAASEMRSRYHPDVIAQRHLEIYRDHRVRVRAVASQT